jgi:GNAT superfamily N-acetyltransferase
MIRVRAARAGEVDALSALCLRSKAHWGYDAEFMRRSVPALTVAPAIIEAGQVLVAEDSDGRLLGVAAVEALETPGEFDLALLFVDPGAIGSGVGRELFDAAVKLAADQGGASLSILADPFAAAFYQHLGAVKIGEVQSDVIPGRRVPLFRYDIS